MWLTFAHPEAVWLLLLLPAAATLPFLEHRAAGRPRQWLGLILRLLIFAGLILALSGAQITRTVDDMTTVFLLDVSDSVDAKEQARAADFIRQALDQMAPRDRAGIVVFGSNALVEQLPSDDARLTRVASVPSATRTDIASAIQLGQALLPADTGKRLVLLSDGQANLGDARLQVRLAAARQIPIDVVPLAPPVSDAEVALIGLHTPSGIRVGQHFELTAVVASTVATSGQLRVWDGDVLVHQRSVRLTPGLNRLSTGVTPEAQGFHRYRAQIATAVDTRPQNNTASTFGVVHGPPRILIVTQQVDEARPLVTALQAADLQTVTQDPADLPTDLTTLASYDTVILANVPLASLPTGADETLATFVSDLGHGLVMIGGEQSFGAGGYLRTPVETVLPVAMDVRSRTQEPNVALVMALDKSGSMGRCHCDDPDGPSVRTEVGIPKVDIAKQAMIEASSLLSDFDYLGVLAFDEQARWVLETQPRVNLTTLESVVAEFGADGGTNIMAGLDQAFRSLRQVEARTKHIILITDGWTNAGGYDTLVSQMHDRGITLSIVAAGRGSAAYLQQLAEAGGGQYYPATTMDEVPRVFLEETVRAIGRLIVEAPLRPQVGSPSPVLADVDVASAPALRGYNGTTAKAAAVVPLVTPEGEPVLAHWQYGLGRSVAWTSDLTGRWAVDWLTWADFPTFAAQMVSWTLPAPQSSVLDTDVRWDGESATIRVDAVDAAGQPRAADSLTGQIIAPDLETTEVDLVPMAAGRYQGTVPVSETGSYLVRIEETRNGVPVNAQTTGFVVAYSPEYTSLTVDTAFLMDAVSATGGRLTIDPAEAFDPVPQKAQRSRPLWTWLLLGALLLFPLDVVTRRLFVSRADIRAAGSWIMRRLSRRTDTSPEERLLSDLFVAKERADRRTWRSDVEPPGES